MSSIHEEKVLGIRARKVLRSVAMKNLGEVFAYEYAPLDVLRSLRDQGYIKIDLKKNTVPSYAEITDEGDMLLDASDFFYKYLAKNEIIESEDSYRILLTREKSDVMQTLAPRKDCDLHEDSITIKAASVDVTKGKLLKTMCKQGFVSFDQETQTYSATKYGLMALQATKVFYDRLIELGFFTENNYENGDEDGFDNEPMSARDAFADFDGESHLERSSDAAE